MQRFTRLYLDLDVTTSTSDKVALLETYFRAVDPRDAAWAVALFTGRRPKGTVSSSVLKSLVSETTGYPPWLVSECRNIVGDLSETAALLLDDASAAVNEPLHETMTQRVLPLAGADDVERREIIARAWGDFDAEMRFVFHKLIRGGFRVGVQERLVARSLSLIAGVDADVMTHRLAGSFEPTANRYRILISGEDEEDRRARPYPFFLAHQLNDPPETLGDIRSWIIEWKWDGARAQVVRRGETVHIWSRGGDILTDQFPEVAAAASELTTDCVLDGEIVLWRHKLPAPFAELQNRLGRTTAPIQMDLFDPTQTRFIAYDLLERDGEDLRDSPLSERRLQLESIVGQETSDLIHLSEILDRDSWSRLADDLDAARDRGVEGLMLKHRGATYGVGRTKQRDGAAWWKLKVAPHTVDAVLVHAQLGAGRRANLFTDYTFAVWKDEDGERSLAPFAKAYSGLDKAEIERLDAWIRQNCIARTGPVRVVEPIQVFEIAFEDIRRSKRHRSGVAVRFPRILRWRHDKEPTDANSLGDLIELIRG